MYNIYRLNWHNIWSAPGQNYMYINSYLTADGSPPLPFTRHACTLAENGCWSRRPADKHGSRIEFSARARAPG